MNNQIAAEAMKYIELMPRKRIEILELAQLADDEVNSGESLDNELSLMAGECDTLLDQEGQA